METIFALASARGKAGIAVIRLAGPDALTVARRLTDSVPSGREARLCRLRWEGEVIDRALVLVFRNGHSYSGDETVEFHLHGSTAVVAKMLSVLAEQPETRFAEPGEFTRRALENGRLDIVQVEALGDLIDAETEGQRKQALRLLATDSRAIVEGWRSDLLRALALVEASIDFSEDDLPDGIVSEILGILKALSIALEREYEAAVGAERVREGFEVAIVGAPNVGKSTLLNNIVGRSVSLTSEHAGTTRDVIEAKVDINGLAVTFLDTAGLREADDPVERLGIELAVRRAVDADLRIFLGDAGVASGILPQEGDLYASPKADLDGKEGGVSGLSGLGVQSLIRRIAGVLSDRVGNSGIFTREREKKAVRSAATSIFSACQSAIARNFELVAEYLRSALDALIDLVGGFDSEEILGSIFSRFCIGK